MFPLFSVEHISKHKEWYRGLLTGMASTRRTLALQLMKDSQTEIPDEALRHFKHEHLLLDAARR